MTTSLEAMKAAREALKLNAESYRGQPCWCLSEPDDTHGIRHSDRCEKTRAALVGLDAAIQRISDCETCDGTGVCYSEWPVRDSDGGMCDIDGEEHPCPDCCAAIQREEGGEQAGRLSWEAFGRQALPLLEKTAECIRFADPPSTLCQCEACGCVGNAPLALRQEEIRRLLLAAPTSRCENPPTPTPGVVSREEAEAACREAARMVGRFVSVPPEPMVPRSRAMEAILDALTFDVRWPDEAKDLFDRWRRETADRIAARILDGEASDGE